MAVDSTLLGQNRTAIGADGQINPAAAPATPAAAPPTAPAAAPAPASPDPAAPAAAPAAPAAPAPDPNSPLDPSPGATPEPAPSAGSPADPAPAPAPAAPEPAPTPAPSAADETLQAQRDALSVRELAVVRGERANKQTEDINGEKLKAYNEAVRLSKEDPLKAIESLGISYQDLTDRVLGVDGRNAEPTSTEKILMEKVEQLEKDLTGETTSRLTAEQQQNYSSYVGDLKNVVDTSGKYPLIGYYSAYDAVVQAVNKHFEATDAILDRDAAMAQVEANLQKDVDGLLALDHLKGRLAPVQPAGPQAPAAPDANAAPAPATPETVNVDPAAPVAPAAPAAPAPAQPAAQPEVAAVVSTLRNAQQGTAGAPVIPPMLSRDESLKEAAKLITMDGDGHN